MKRILFLLMSFVLLISCSSSDDEVSQEDWARQNQEVMYNKVVSTIVGHWKGYQHYNTSPYREYGWEDISNISWTQEYIFNADGTCKDIFSPNLIYEGTYHFRKNEEYLKYPTSCCELFVVITYDDGREVEQAIWIDDYKDEYMHTSLSPFGLKPHYTSGGEASIRYKKY